MITINDIAKMANVSKSTVSRYLNGKNIKPLAKERIEQAIKETGYKPNSFAQSLKAHQTNLIGIVVSKLDSYAVTQSLQGIDNELKKSGYKTLITNTYQDINNEIQGLYTFEKQKVAGIIIFGTIITSSHIKAFSQISCPIVMISQKSEHVHCVYHDDYGAGTQIGNYIAALNHKKVLYFGANEDDVAIGIKRKKGVTDALTKAGVCFECITTTLMIEDACATALKVLPTTKATYIVCATDQIAVGVMKAIRILNKDIPKDFSISGFGGDEIGDAIHPTLTTVKYHYIEAGRQTAKQLKKILKNREVDKMLCLENDLLIRNSTNSL